MSKTLLNALFLARRHIALLIAVVFTTLWGSFLILAEWLLFDSDMAVMALMGMHISQGREFPIFLYGQNYIGSLDAWLLAPTFALFGATVDTVLFFTLLQLLVVQLLVYTLAYRTSGIAAAGWAVWYLALPPSYYVLRGFGSISGGYNLVNILGLVSFLIGWSTLRRYASQQPVAVWLFTLGVVLGLGCWTNPMILYFAAPLFLCLLWFAPALILNVRRCSLFVLGFFLGSLPFWYHNLWVIPFGTLRHETMLQITPCALWAERVSSFLTLGLPIILGARPWGSINDFFPGASLIGYGAALLCVAGTALSLNRAKLQNLFPRILFLLYLFLMPIFFTLNYRSSFVIEPRYLFPLYAVFPVIFGITVSGLSTKHRALGLLAAILILSLNVVSLSFTTPVRDRTKDSLIPDLQKHWTSGVCLPWWFARTKDKLIPILKEKQITTVYTNYWIAYKLTFESQEKILAVPAGMMCLVRYLPHATEIAKRDRVAYLFDLYEAEKLIRLLQQQEISYEMLTVSYLKAKRLLTPPDLILIYNLCLPGGPLPPGEGAPFRIDLGSLLAQRHLLGGWSANRVDRMAGQTGVWATERHASLWVDLPPNRVYKMTIHVTPYIYPGHPPQCLRASIDGIDLGKRLLSEEGSAYTFVIPPLSEQESPQRTVLFSFCYAKSLTKVGCGQSEDSRELSVFFDYVEFIPLPETHRSAKGGTP